MQSELKSCPFCGGEASIGHVAFSRPLAHIEWEDGTPVTEAFYGHCKNCSASTRNGFHGGQRNEAEAITAWNTRASDAEITRLTEALRAAEDQVKGLREALGEICSDSNPDWTERRVYPNDVLDDIHKIAVEAFYGVKS